MLALNRPGSVCNLSINSAEDIERAISHSQENQEKVSKILDGKYHGTIEQTAKNLDLLELFNNAYTQSLGTQVLGFTTCQRVKSDIDQYRTLLLQSITVCDDILTPLFIRSFKSQQVALGNFTMTPQQKPAATVALNATQELAKTICSEYKKLQEEFRTAGEKASKTLVSLSTEQASIGSQLRELEKRQKKGESLATDAQDKTILEAASDSSDVVSNSYGKIVTAIRNVSMFWTYANLHSEDLTDTSILDMYAQTEGMEQEFIEEFESNYLKWLALAKINQTALTFMRNAISDKT